jgi:hypothetical protein
VVDAVARQHIAQLENSRGIVARLIEGKNFIPIQPFEIETDNTHASLQYNGISAPHLSESGLGRAVMVLSRRPDETKENRKMAATLVTKWARPIFGLDEKPNAADMIPQQNFAP